MEVVPSSDVVRERLQELRDLAWYLDNLGINTVLNLRKKRGRTAVGGGSSSLPGSSTAG